MMFSLTNVALFLTASTTVHSQVVYDRYAGYQPTTLITDYAAIDQDQMIINEETGERALLNAWHVYTEGGHSGSYAELTGINMTHSFHHKKGNVVRGLNAFLGIVNGTLLEDAAWTVGDGGDVVFKVLYDVGPHQEEYSDCTVGGLFGFGAGQREGCFVENGSIDVVLGDGEIKQHKYTYNNRRGNKNLNTIQKLSTEAVDTMKGLDGKYIKEFQTFYDYYGDFNYGDKWITAAYFKTDTGFTSKRGNSDFSTLTKRDGQGDAMKKGSAYLNIWMEVVRLLNDAVEKCPAGDTSAEESLDKAVAYYAGGRTTEENDEGVLLYALAEVRAHQMKTAGHLDDKDVGDAFINVEIFRQLKIMQANFVANDVALCDDAALSKEQIVTLMKVPMIQSIIRYAYIQEKEPPVKQEDRDKMVAEGATYAATMLPFVHKCNSRAAETLHANMKLGVIAKFDDVKKVLESTYDCLEVTCELVGGVWDQKEQRYNALPCGVNVRSPAATASMVVGIGAGIVLAAYLFMKYRNKMTFLHKKRNKEMPPMYNTGNIAAVTEIA